MLGYMDCTYMLKILGYLDSIIQMFENFRLKRKYHKNIIQKLHKHILQKKKIIKYTYVRRDEATSWIVDEAKRLSEASY